MGKHRLVILISLVVAGGAVGIFRTAAPGSYGTVVHEIDWILPHVPEPVVLGATVLALLAVWVAALILLAKALYWGWQQVDEHVFRLWNLVLPKSPIVRFGVGLIIMIFLFLFVPLLFLQGADLTGPEEQVNETLETNETDETTNTTADSSDINSTQSNSDNVPTINPTTGGVG